MKVWNSKFRFLPIIFAIFLTYSSSESLKEKIFADGMGELLTATGNISITGKKNSSENTDRVVFQNSEIHVKNDSFAHLYFRNGMYVKSRGNSKFSVRKLKAMSVISFQLLDGEMAMTLPGLTGDLALREWEVEVVTPLGTVTFSQGDALIAYNAEQQFLRIYTMDGRVLFSLDSLQLSLNPGEKVVVKDNKVTPKSDIKGSENRMLFSWYRQGGLWRIPSYLNQFSQLNEDKPVVLKKYRINGLDQNEFIDHQTFSSADLILGRLRIEGELENKLPHQVLQISLNDGRDYYDVEAHDGFVWKVRPEERHYQLRFRLRDLERYYEIIHDDINFYYQRKGNQQLVKEWLQQIENFYFSKDVFRIAELLQDCESFPKSLREDLTKEFLNATFQRLHLTIIRYREYADRIIVNFKYRTVRTLISNVEPVRQQGRFEVIFFNQPKWGFKVRHMTGELPFLNSLKNNRLDSRGPTILGPSILPLTAFGNTPLTFRVEDDLSKIRTIEYFLDEIGINGKGRKVQARDGRFDERIEEGQILLRADSGNLRVYLHAQDQSGNWGEFFSVTLAR